MTISNKLKERFCRDCNLPIKLFDEPYFMNRIKLLDKVYGCEAKFNNFLEEYFKAGYINEEEYFAEYNRVKDAAINFIKNTEAYQRFNACDMNEYRVNLQLPSSEIYKPSNSGRHFISIDMKKANFNALHNYDATIFDGCSTWEEFIQKFTSNTHIISSKYIRQVILGNCNPKRHIAYEKYITYHLYASLNRQFNLETAIEFFSNDEIVLDGNVVLPTVIAKHVAEFSRMTGVDFRVTDFILRQIDGTAGYYKDISNDEGANHIYEFKCLASHEIPFVIRAAIGELPNELDRYFIAEGRLASFINPIDVKIPVLYKEKD